MFALLKTSLIIGLVALNAFFVSTEYALLSVRRTRLEQLAKRHLSLGPITTAQIGRIEQLPRRSPMPPAAAAAAAPLSASSQLTAAPRLAIVRTGAAQ